MNFSPRSALKLAPLVLAAVLAGCGEKDGVKELTEGKAAYAAKDLVKAIKLFEKSGKYAPDNVDMLVYLAKAKLELGELEGANKAITHAGELAGDCSDVRLLAAQIAWHLKDFLRASELFIGIANDQKLPPEVRSQGLSGLGIVNMAGGSSHLARVNLLTAIRLDRRNPAAWYHLGLLYRDAPFSYNEAALDQFEIFVRLEENASPRVQKTLKTIIPGIKESINQALADRPGVAKRDSKACAVALAKADDAWKRGNYKTALQNYQQAYAHDVLSYPAAFGVAKALVKVEPGRQGQVKAFEMYKQACILRPSAVSTFITAGNLAMNVGYPAQAVEFFSRAVAANPTSLDALDGMIRAMRKSGWKQSTVKAYQLYRDSLPTKTKKR